LWHCNIWKCHKMSQNVTLFQIFGTKLRLPFMFGSGLERLWLFDLICCQTLLRHSRWEGRAGRWCWRLPCGRVQSLWCRWRSFRKRALACLWRCRPSCRAMPTRQTCRMISRWRRSKTRPCRRKRASTVPWDQAMTTMPFRVCQTIQQWAMLQQAACSMYSER